MCRRYVAGGKRRLIHSAVPAVPEVGRCDPRGVLCARGMECILLHASARGLDRSCSRSQSNEMLGTACRRPADASLAARALGGGGGGAGGLVVGRARVTLRHGEGTDSPCPPLATSPTACPSTTRAHGSTLRARVDAGDLIPVSCGVAVAFELTPRQTRTVAAAATTVAAAVIVTAAGLLGWLIVLFVRTFSRDLGASALLPHCDRDGRAPRRRARHPSSGAHRQLSTPRVVAYVGGELVVEGAWSRPASRCRSSDRIVMRVRHGGEERDRFSVPDAVASAGGYLNDGTEMKHGYG